MWILTLFIGFIIGIFTMAIAASSGQADKRERAQRNEKRLTIIAWWWYWGKRNEDPVEFVNKFPKEALEGWVNEG